MAFTRRWRDRDYSPYLLGFVSIGIESEMEKTCLNPSCESTKPLQQARNRILTAGGVKRYSWNWHKPKGEPMGRTFITAGTLLLLLCCVRTGQAADPWPAEAWAAAETLTHLDGDFENNMSGAAWNPKTETFWVCCNGGPSAFWALTEDESNSFMIATNGSGTQAKYDLGKGDFEGICHADYSEPTVYIMVEEDDQIREYDVSVYGSAVLNLQWNIAAHVPTSGGAGSEGITFVPNEWLMKEHFVDGNGTPYLSTNGMGGLMLVAHQNGGRVYAFDLNPTNSAFHFVGAYATSRSESSGLEFDRSTGLLYIWHNTGPNYLEVTELSSYQDGAERRLTPLAEFLGPKSGNLEGIAIVPTATTNHWCLIVDDDNQDDAALMWFKEFEHTNDFDGDGMADSWELAYLASTTTSDGSADSDNDHFSDLNEYLAGTIPTNPESALLFTDLSFQTNSQFILEWLSASNKSYSILSSTNLSVGFDGIVTNGLPAAPPVNSFTHAAGSATTLFYRILLDL
jgi:hypothetical protein